MNKIVCFLNVLFIYFAMLIPVSLFFSNDVALFGFIWFYVFRNIFVPVAILIVISIVALILNGCILIKAIAGTCDVEELVKSNWKVRLIQMPAYIGIFFVGLVCSITIFTIGFSIAYVIVDGISIMLSGIYAVATYKRLKDVGVLTTKEFAWYSVLSFIFCLDVVVSILAYHKFKKYEFVK